MRFTDKSCRDFAELLSGREPVPGGGGASALVGALAAALGSMVGSLTVGKKKYADVQKEIEALMDEAERLRKELLQLVEEDAEAFAPLAGAYGMPQNTEKEKQEKERVMEAALQGASETPLAIMRKCCQIIDLQREFARKGSRLAVSDAGVGVIFAKSALQGASLNVFINTKSMKNRESAEAFEREADQMLLEYTAKADEIYADVCGQLRA